MEIPRRPENEDKRLEALNATKLLDSSKEAVFDNLTLLVSQFFDVPIVAISLIDEVRQWFKSIQGLDVCETCRDISFCGHVIYKGSPIIISDARVDQRFYDNPLVKNSPNIVFYAGVPIRYAYKGEVYYLGTLCIIDYLKRSFSPEELEMLGRFAFLLESLIETRLPAQKFDALSRQLATESIELKDLEDNIRHLQTVSETDLLTELPNRRYLKRILEDTWYGDMRQKNICLMMIDLDNFKQVNDAHGHHVGDVILKNVAQGLKSLVRLGEDTLCRFGGDEFILVSFNQQPEGLTALAQKILRHFIDSPAHADFRDITVSIGGCISTDKAHDFETLLKSADAQLYKAKADGKNQFEFEELN